MGHPYQGRKMSHLRPCPRGAVELLPSLNEYCAPMVGDGVVHVHSALMLYATPACLLLALLFRPLWLRGRAEQHGLRMDAAEGRRFSQRPEVQRTHAACAKGWPIPFA